MEDLAMKLTGKKALALLLTVVLAFSAALTVFAEDASGDPAAATGDFDFQIDQATGGITIIGFDGTLGSDGILSIPDTIGSGKVTAIADSCFAAKDGDAASQALADSIWQVIVPDTVTYIGTLAFSGCKNMQYLDIYSKDLTIGSYAFAGCKALSNITFHNGEDGIMVGMCAFNDTAWYAAYPIDWVMIGKTLISYKGCDADVKIPLNVTAIGDGAFYNNKTVKTVELTDKVTSIGDYAFNGCSALTDIVFPVNSVITSIGFDAFDGTPYLADYAGDFFTIGTTLVRYCGDSTTVFIPNTITAVAPDAFKGAYKLSKDGYAVFAIRVPSSVKSFGSDCFTLFNEEDGTSFTPYLYVYKDSPAAAYAQAKGFDYEVIGKPGDVDVDGSVTTEDARLALRIATKLDRNATEVQKITANVDGDEAVTAADARMILRIAIGLEGESDLTNRPMTAFEVLQCYNNAVKNAAKYGAGYTLVSYQELSDWNLDANTSLYIKDWKTKGITTKNEAKAKVYEMDSQAAKAALPPVSLLDSSVIEDYGCKAEGGKYTITLTLKNETISTVDTNNSIKTYTAKLFPVVTRSVYDSSLADRYWFTNKDKYNSLTYDMVYEGCTLTAVIDIATGNLVSIDMAYTMHLDNIDGVIYLLNVASSGRKTGTGDIVIKNTVKYSDFKYYLDAPDDNDYETTTATTSAATTTTKKESLIDKIKDLINKNSATTTTAKAEESSAK